VRSQPCNLNGGGSHGRWRASAVVAKAKRGDMVAAKLVLDPGQHLRAASSNLRCRVKRLTRDVARRGIGSGRGKPHCAKSMEGSYACWSLVSLGFVITLLSVSLAHGQVIIDVLNLWSIRRGQGRSAQNHGRGAALCRRRKLRRGDHRNRRRFQRRRRPGHSRLSTSAGLSARTYGRASARCDSDGNRFPGRHSC